jgi:hypothetical protein
MKYYVTFQEMGDKGRPIDHPSTADFETEQLGMLPAVGDYVQIDPLGDKDGPSYSGRVKSRLFRYIGPGNCGINIVVDPKEDDQEGALIKE